jgi:TRAP-type mannitol/chloroaromatic compound transport system substrate-binding protein
MSALAQLKLISAKRPLQLSPIVQRRNKVIERLHQQILLATAAQEGKTYAPTKLRTVKNEETGETSTVQVTKRIKESWYISNDGKLCVSLKYGAKVVEFSKGKTAVELASANELVPTLETLKKAVEGGELDEQLTLVSGAVKAAFKK